MKKRLAILILVIFNTALFAFADNQYTTIHQYNTTLEILSPSKAEAKFYKKWTIYSYQDIEDAEVIIYYDPNYKVKDLSLNIQIAESNYKEKLSIKAFSDVSISRGFEINDGRALIYTHANKIFPITMELEYSVEMKGLVYFPDWLPLSETNVVLKKAKLELITPANYKLGIRETNLKAPQIESNGSNIFYNWEIDTSYGPLIHEVHSPPFTQNLPRVMLSPGDFEFENSKGNMETWSGMGKWIDELSLNRTKLDKETRHFLHQQFGNLSTQEEKVKKVYEWVQSRCRYVSVQLGIGGWQPESATEVNKKGYGDCKGLSNFTKAALSELGIKADYCLVYSNPYYDKCNSDFPSIQSFNHAILRVVLPQDTLWLECTSNKTPYNGITPYIAGKNALLVDGDNSKLVKIPFDENNLAVVNSKLKVSLNDEGNADVDCRLQYSDILFYDYLYVEDFTSKDKRKLFDENIYGSAYKLESCSYRNFFDRKLVECTAELRMNSVWRKLGDEIYYNPVVLNNELPELPANPKRYNDLIFHRSYNIIDTSVIQFPGKYCVGYLPEDTILNTNFGKTKIFYIIEENNLKVVTAISIPSARYAASEYENARKFLMDTRMLMDRKVIFKKAP